MGTKIIMAVCCLPCLLMLYGFLYMEGKQKGNILMGVTLWPKAEQDERVIAIQKRFKREMHILFLLSILLFVLTCIPDRDSVFFSLMILWLLFIIVIFFFPVAWGNGRLKSLKREWKAAQGEAAEKTDDIAENEAEKLDYIAENEAEKTDGHKRYVDLKAAAQPKKKPFLKLSMIGTLGALIPVIAEIFLAKNGFYGWWTEVILVTMFLTGAVCLWIQYSFWHLGTDVVSLRSEVNIQLARVRQYQWSRFCCIMIWCNTIFTMILWWGMYHPKQTFFSIFISAILYMVVVIAAAVWTEYGVRKVYGKYAVEPSLQVDEDEYWLWGMWYYNKNDKRFMVNKRVGIGTTVNMAKTSGKVFTIGISIATVVMLIWVAALVLMEDFVPISLKMENETVVSSQYKKEYSIPIGEIENAELVEELPAMSKRVGSAMDSMLKGSFLDEEYQSCKVCVRRQKPPFIKLLIADGMIYYLNDEEAEVTEQVYQQIIAEKK